MIKAVKKTPLVMKPKQALIKINQDWAFKGLINCPYFGFFFSNSLLMSNVYECPKMILWADGAVHVYVHVHVHVDHYFTNIVLYKPKWTWWGSPCLKIYLFVS